MLEQKLGLVYTLRALHFSFLEVGSRNLTPRIKILRYESSFIKMHYLAGLGIFIYIGARMAFSY